MHCRFSESAFQEKKIKVVQTAGIQMNSILTTGYGKHGKTHNSIA
jgi:hypothetical protein